MDKTPFSGNSMTALDTFFDRHPLETPRESKPAAARLHGLCSTCNSASYCSYLTGRNGQPIFFCEEFDGSALPVPGRFAPESAGSSDNRHDIVMGLCANCAQLEVCRFPKPEGGVWHCEEYE